MHGGSANIPFVKSVIRFIPDIFYDFYKNYLSSDLYYMSMCGGL